MRKHNAENERIKREYLSWMGEAQGRSEATLDHAASAIARYEADTGYRPFKTFNRDRATAFKRHLVEAQHPTTGKPLSQATVCATLKAVRAFFEWLSREPGYRRDVRFSDAAYLNPNANDLRIATAARTRPAPSLEQVHHVIAATASETHMERRDRAVVAFNVLTGARDAAIASIKLKHLDLVRGRVFQDARDVKTKGAKTFMTPFFAVGGDAEAIVRAWAAELTTDHLFGPDDPLFPRTLIGLDERGHFKAVGLDRAHWQSAAPIRLIFRRAFEAVGLPYFNPHALRQTITRRAFDLELTPRQLKAWSLSLGHTNVLTTLTSYGHLTEEEQTETMERIAANAASPGGDEDAIIKQAMTILSRRTS